MTIATAPTSREERTRAYGREIFARLDRRGPLVFSPAWLDDQLMQWSMGDEAVKVQLFRFIDALPNLKSSEEVSQHLKEYFSEAGGHLPPWIRRAVGWLPRDGAGGRLLAWAADRNAKRMARRFIAGSTVEEALETIAAMRRRSLGFTIDLLGEATITESEAEQYQRQYFDLIEGLSREVNTWPAVELIDTDAYGPIPRVNVSVKLTSLYSQFDPIAPEATSEAVRRRLRPVLRLARRHGAFVNVDMEQYSYKDITLRIFKEVLAEDEFRDWPDVGIAIQAYLRDTDNDLADLLRWVERRGAPVWVRLVKGAYWDYETILAEQNGWEPPVYLHKWQTDAAYERATRYLLAHHRLLRPAFGSHNVRSIAHALAAAEELGVPPRSFEFQALYGMADPIKDALVGMGQRVRVYTPYGQLLPGMAYLVRRLLENTSNESFLRASFREHVPEEQLLKNPADCGVRSAECGFNGQPQAETHEPRPLATTEATTTMNGTTAQAASRTPQSANFQNEPLTDFSREENRQKMLQGLETVKKQLGRTYPLVIGGQRVSTPQTFPSVNPSRTSEVIGQIARATPENARQAIAAAAKAFETWRDTDPKTRAEYLFKAADAIRKRHFEFAAWACVESAKPWREADVEVGECIDFLEYYGREALRLFSPRTMQIAGEDNEYVYEPRGVAVVIAPWNFPLAILAGMTAAAVVTGNTAIMKPSEQSSVMGAKLMEVWEAAGLPPGVVNYLPGIGEEIGPTLVESPDVAIVAFTGSQAVGLTINAEAAQTGPDQDHVKRVIAEMGGKNATIVDSDADLDEAVKGVVEGAFGYQGQKCSACSRAIVLAPVYDQFLNRLIEATRSLKVGPADDPATTVGPVIDEDSRKRVRDYIEKGKQEAKLVYAGDAGELKDQGTFVAPHVFADVSPQATIAQEEIFGPVLSVIKVNDLNEALKVATGVRYALTGAVYTRSPEHIHEAKRRFRVGNLYINRKCTGAMVCRQPFGGFKMSGIGSKAGGPDYLLQFVLPRTITENTLRRGFAPETAATVPGTGKGPPGGGLA
jgi:RHH-type proline utilization regulon transcriptional repressor/proline dehydrogenase/delta 1-pyrroline-5-carboxylate dehydrogenase